MKAILKLLVAVAAIAWSVTSADAACWQWSKTASNNATVDPSINWSEGMSPSSVNDSARAMMARLAECRDDWSGALTLAGSSTAYTVTTNQGLPSTPITGQMLAFFPNVTNGNGATLQADGGGVFPIQITAGSSAPAGTIIAGSPYRATFNGTAWVLEGIYGSPFSIPLGGFLWSSTLTPPNSNFILPAGQCISRTTYAAYFALVGIGYGACDGSSTFGVPDLRGRVMAAPDNLNGTPAGRLTASQFGCGVTFVLGSVCGAEGQTLTIAQIPSHNHANTLNDPGHSHTLTGGGGGSCCWQPGGSNTAFGPLFQNSGGSFTGMSINNAFTGGGNAHPNVQPSFGAAVFLRVL